MKVEADAEMTLLLALPPNVIFRIGDTDVFPYKGVTMNVENHIAARGLNTSDAAQYISFSESFLRKARMGITDVAGPNFKKIGKRVVYLREDLDAFLEQSAHQAA